MMMLMQMLMAVHQLFMPVRMLMNQIRTHQKIRVEKKVFRLTTGGSGN